MATLLRTSNPALSDALFQRAGRARTGGDVMTIDGTVTKTGVLVLLLLVSGAVTWTRALAQGPGAAMPLVILGLIGGLVLALVGVFKPSTTPVVAPLYALAEGLVLGAVSAMYQTRYQGVPVQAVSLTVFTLAALLVAYRAGLVRATENFKLGVVAATGGIALYYVAGMVAGMFHVALPLIHSTGALGLLFTLGVVVVAALNLVLDFDFIERAAAGGAPGYMEWAGAMGLILTLVSVKWNTARKQVSTALWNAIARPTTSLVYA